MVDVPKVDETIIGERILVPFEGGDRTGDEALSWGQQELWLAMQEQNSWLPIGATQDLPPGTTMEDAIADLRFVMCHYPSMRTRLRLDPGQPPRQVVHASGELSLEIVDADDDADPAKIANQVWWRYWRQDYDFVSEWPVRMAVVRHRGQLTHRPWIMCHLVTDGGGSQVILDELARRDSSGSRAAQSPLEQARWQRSPAGIRHNDAAMRYWERVLRTIPARRFPPRTAQPRPRYWQARLDSPAMYQAGRLIAARTGTEVSSVLLAVYAVAMARVIGVNPVVFQVNVSNRFRGGLNRSVSPVMQTGLCVVELPDATMDEAAVLVRRRAMMAYKYAYYDPTQRQELLERVSRERGEQVDIRCSVNDRRLTPTPDPDPPAPELVRNAPEGDFLWRYKQDEIEFYPLDVMFDELPGTIRCEVTTDAHRLDPADVEGFIRAMEEIAVAAALDPATRTRVPAVSRS